METKELRKKSRIELVKMLAELREKLRDMRFKAAQRQLKKVREIRTTKRVVARILTLLKEESRKEKDPAVSEDNESKEQDKSKQ